MSLGRELNEFAASFGATTAAGRNIGAMQEQRERRKARAALDPNKSPEMKNAMAQYQKDYGSAPPDTSDTGGWGSSPEWGTGETSLYEKGGYVDEDPQYFHSEYADGGYVELGRKQREWMLANTPSQHIPGVAPPEDTAPPGPQQGIPAPQPGVPSETLEEDNWRNAGNDDSSVYEPEPARGDPVMTAPMSRPGERAPSDYRNSPPPAQPAGASARTSAIPVPTSGGYSTPGNAPPKATSDQTRTAAYNPETEGPVATPAPAGATAQPAGALPAGAVGAVRGEPYNPAAKGEGTSSSAADDLQAAIKGGLDFAQQTFHLKGTSAMPGTDPNQQRGGEALMKGMGAAPPETVAKLNRAVNAGVPRDEAIWGIRRLEAVYRFYSGRGETEKANKAAFELLQYSAGMAAKYGTQAVQSIKQGDEKGAMSNIINAHRFIPDGRKLVPDPSGKSVAVVDLKTGDTLQELPVTPQAMFQLAMGLSNRSAYWDVIMHRAAGTGQNRDKQTPEQKAQTIARTKLIEARTAKLQGGGTGRGGGAGTGASTGLLDKIREMDAKTGVGGGGAPRAPAPAPVAQGSEDTSDEGGDDGADEPRGVRPPNADGEGGGETPSSPVPAPSAPNSVLRVKPPRADQATNVSPSALIGGAGPGGDRAAPTAPTAGTAAVPPKGSRPTSTAKTWDGYPARQNDDGSQSTEFSITVTDPRLNNGRPTNIPSMWRGQQLDEDAAVKNAVSHGAVWPSFKTIDEAVKAAGARSEAKGRGQNVGDPFLPDPDAVPEQELWIDGKGGYQRPAAAPEPVPFDEEKPGPNPYKALQVEAAKIPGREGAAARQLLAKRVADYDKQAGGWDKRKKEHEKAEKLRVTSEGKAAKEQQKKMAGENGYNLKTDKVQDGITWGKELDESYTAVEDRLKQPGADGKVPDIKTTVFGDGSATKEQLKDLALDLRTANPRTNAEKAFRLIEQLVRIDPEDRQARGYKVAGRDAIGNVVLAVTDKEGNPTRNVVHIRQPAFDALKGIVKQRHELRTKEKPAEGGFWKDVDAASKSTAKGVTAAGKYALGTEGPSTMAGDLLRVGKKVGATVGNPGPAIAGAVGNAVRKGARGYDPDEPSSKIMQGIPTP